VLIFATNFSDDHLAEVKGMLDGLLEPPESTAQETREQVATTLTSGDPVFELLSPPPVSQGQHPVEGLLRFRLTGRQRFGIDAAVNLAEAPYCVDIDAMNLDLSRLVCATQGGAFLAVGSGVDRTGRSVVALVWQCAENGFADGEAQKPLLEVVMDTARVEANLLLKRHFGHVLSCRCGQ